MLEVYTGVPGSGKTYRAVDHAYNCFIDKNSKYYGKYKRLYTNINEFDFDTFNAVDDSVETSPKNQFVKVFSIKRKKRELIASDSAVVADAKALSINFDNLILILDELHKLYLTNATDLELMALADELNVSDSLFIIDEAHNFFSAENKTLIWWLTYHRHLHQDIILITQNFSLIYRKYLTCGEFFYRAVQSSLRVRDGIFTYHQFISSKLYKKDHTDTIKVKFNPAVFALYSSGANTQGKKVIRKFIIIGVLLVVLVFGFFKLVIPMMWGGADSNTTKSVNKPQGAFVTPTIDHSSTFTVVCIGFDCSSLGHTFSLPDLNGYAKQYGLQSIETVVINNDITLRTYGRNDKFSSEVLNVPSSASASN